jgi:sodium/hydrogen exchanger 8
MWYCGFRGAMAYALALDAADTFNEEGKLILTLTVVIIALNVYIYNYNK